MSVTIYDIAEKAGVSIATVSRVFSSSANVSEKNRKKVLEVAEKLGYYPQGFARGLANKRHNTITALVPILSNYFFMEVLAGIQDKITENQFDLNIYNIASNGTSILEQTQNVLKKRMADGYLFISIHLKNEQWKKLARYNLPITLIDEYYSGFDSVSVDSVRGAYQATEYFIKNGYKKIGFISALEQSEPIKQRTKGFIQAHDDYNLEVDKNLIVRADIENRDGFTEKGGFISMKQILEKESPPEACLCASDIQAFGALKAMRDYNKSIPLISFDDIEIAEYLSLNTMRQPMYDMGYMATQKIIDRINNKDHSVSHTVYTPELIIRTELDQTIAPLKLNSNT